MTSRQHTDDATLERFPSSPMFLLTSRRVLAVSHTYCYPTFGTDRSYQRMSRSCSLSFSTFPHNRAWCPRRARVVLNIFPSSRTERIPRPSPAVERVVVDLSAVRKIASLCGLDDIQVLREDGGLVFCRGWRDGTERGRDRVLIARAISEQPTPSIVERLFHEYSLKPELDSTWAARPLELVQDHSQIILVLEDFGGELLGGLLGAAMEVGHFLRIAVGIAAALGKDVSKPFGSMWMRRRPMNSLAASVIRSHRSWRRVGNPST
jgi:hypothetical protein